MAEVRLLAVRDLTVQHAGSAGPVFTGLDLDLDAGECLAVVGPSGCGKSTLCRALLDLLPAGSRLGGSIRWRGVEMTSDPLSWHGLRGAGIGLLLQDHRFALDPIRRVGAQVAEVVRRHRPGWTRDRVATAVLELLAEVRLPYPGRLARRYPHQISGGQRQRACLAAALAAEPRLLLADEPTTALDPLVQRDIIRLLRDLVERRGLALLLVTHDRALVPLIAERTLHLPSPADQPPADASPACPDAADADQRRPVCLRVRGLRAAVAAPGGRRIVVRGVDLALHPGRTLGLAGESGAGKTTLARVLAGWHPREDGSVELAGAERLSVGQRLRAVQLVSQDAIAALDPRQGVLSAVVEAARAAGDAPADAARRARSLLCEVDLDPALARRRPAELSGGQRQRVQLARALAARPQVLVADEPASSLDHERRANLVQLLRRLQRSHGLALLVVSHDLAWLEGWCDEVAVMLAGLFVEQYRPGAPQQPRHPYARDLAAAASGALRRASLMDAPAARASLDPDDAAGDGCPYAARCSLVQPACRCELPSLRDGEAGHRLRCPLADHHGR